MKKILLGFLILGLACPLLIIIWDKVCTLLNAPNDNSVLSGFVLLVLTVVMIVIPVGYFLNNYLNDSNKRKGLE